VRVIARCLRWPTHRINVNIKLILKVPGISGGDSGFKRQDQRKTTIEPITLIESQNKRPSNMDLSEFGKRNESKRLTSSPQTQLNFQQTLERKMKVKNLEQNGITS
jgi:hypothetical protein